MDCPLIPIGDKVVVKKNSSKGMTPGGLFIPDEAREDSYEGIVVAVGKGTVNAAGVLIPLQVQVGDKVFYAPHAGVELKAGDQWYLILRGGDKGDILMIAK